MSPRTAQKKLDPADTGKPISLIYIGRRNSVKGTTLYTFLDGKTERFWGKINGVWIGGIYEGSRGKDGSIMLAKRPKRIGVVDDADDKRTEWEIADSLVQARLDEKRAEKKFKEDKKLRVFAKSLAPLLKGIGYMEVQYFIQALTQMAHEERRKK